MIINDTNTEAYNLQKNAKMYLLKEDSKRLELSKSSYVFVTDSLKDPKNIKSVSWLDEDDSDEVYFLAYMTNEEIENELVEVDFYFLEKIRNCYRNTKQSYYQNYKDACNICELELEKLTK